MLKREFRVILLSLVVSFVLTIAKFTAYFMTHSVAILSDALESIINVVAGAFASYSIYLTSKPRDENHPYGHGKVEFFSIGFEGAMIFIAGCLILFKAIQYFFTAVPIEDVDHGVWITGGTTIANLILGRYLLFAGKRAGSITLTGNGQHIMTDVYSSVALIVALLLIHFTGWTWIDPATSTVMGSFILYNGYRLLRKSISGLMDETDMKVVDKVIGVLSEHRRPMWIDVHNMRVQQYGSNYHIDCHITMPYYLELSQAHAEMKVVDEVINAELKNGETEFFIHTDPCVPASCPCCQLLQCPVRSHPFIEKIEWSRSNVLPNRKHGE
ncbi:cation diffusion facilitator family transporter [Chitinophaga sedimenti]|uniref:cation diffusion facilitator family transporter n=1 Tax=Chitinophaga sedimenti TaxID=2033606 RepID=UPI00200585A2|nr:cation diffusion facilitator family transporter [Chitinophaga sedimenti]MCK7555218.1 cation diffusion facilitator family transporter [Chitinophaga sedimenti]